MKYWYYAVSVQLILQNKEGESFLFTHKLFENEEELFPVITALDYVKAILEGFGKTGPAVELKMTIVNQIEISKETFEGLKPPYVGFQ